MSSKQWRYITLVLIVTILIALGHSVIPTYAQSDDEVNTRVDQAMQHLGERLDRTVTRQNTPWQYTIEQYADENLGCGVAESDEANISAYNINITIDKTVYNYRVKANDGASVILCVNNEIDPSSIINGSMVPVLESDSSDAPTTDISSDGSVANVFFGFFNGSNDVMNSVVCGADTAYFAFQTSFDTSGTYQYSDSNFNGIFTFDMYLEVYDGEFDVNDPTENYVGEFDDSGEIEFSSDGFYTFVVIPNGCESDTEGTPFFTISGPGNATNTYSGEDGTVFASTINANSPTYDRGDCEAPVAYAILEGVSPDITGTYFYADISYGNQMTLDVDYRDMTISIYEGNFDPNAPEENLLTTIDDNGSFFADSEQGYSFVYSPLDCTATDVTLQFMLYGPPTSITANNAIMETFVSPNGEQAFNADEMPITLPANGEEESYLIGSIEEVDGVQWVEIIINHQSNAVWVPFDSIVVE